MLLSFLMFLAGAQVETQLSQGAWQFSERCWSQRDNFGCIRSMAQSSLAIDVTLSFRDEFDMMEANVRSCDQEPVMLSFRRPLGNDWRKLSVTERASKVRNLLEAWM